MTSIVRFYDANGTPITPNLNYNTDTSSNYDKNIYGNSSIPSLRFNASNNSISQMMKENEEMWDILMKEENNIVNKFRWICNSCDKENEHENYCKIGFLEKMREKKTRKKTSKTNDGKAVAKVHNRQVKSLNGLHIFISEGIPEGDGSGT